MSEPSSRAPTVPSATGKTAGQARDLDRIAAIVRQDRLAFDALYREYYPRLMDFVVRIVGHGGVAEEVVNDTMYVVWTRAESFAGRSRVSTWIFGIAYKQAIKRLDREGRHRLERIPEDWDAHDGIASVESDISVLQEQEMLDKALQRLSPSHRSVVELTYHFGYSYGEIARIVGCPVNTVKTRMFHARNQMRQVLERFARRGR